MAQSSTQHESRSTVWIERLVWTLVLLACGLSISPNVADPDLWGHVQYGRDLLNSGSVPATTSYTYTAEDYRWINHENASEVVMAVVADYAGHRGLAIGKWLLGMVLIVAMILYNRRVGVGLTANAGMALLVSANLAYHWSVRPQLASFLLFGLLILLLQFCFAGWRGRWHWPVPRRWFERGLQPEAEVAISGSKQNQLGHHPQRLRWLWLVVPLFWIWANAHGGFVAGLCIFGLYMFSRAVEAVSRRGSASWGLVRRMALMVLVAGLATMINPYSFGLHQWLLESLGRPRPEILDWSNHQLWTLVGFKFWGLLAVVLFALALSRRRYDATELLVLVVVLWQSVTHFRHVPFFTLLVGFWVAPHLQSALDRITSRMRASASSRLCQQVAVAGLVLAILIVGRQLGKRLERLQVQRAEYPVAALQFMRANDVHGRLLVTYDWAQYAIAALCANDAIPPSERSEVAFDGRFRTAYPQSIADMHFDFLYGEAPVKRYRSPQSPPIDPGRALHYGDPEIVLIARGTERSSSHMEARQERWTLLYQDSVAQVWGLKDRFDDPRSADYLPPDRRQISNRAQVGSVDWPALPAPHASQNRYPVNFTPGTDYNEND